MDGENERAIFLVCVASVAWDIETQTMEILVDTSCSL